MIETNATFYMQKALVQAQKAKQKNEVPVGAVIVFNNKIIAKAYNKKHKRKCAVWHAEIVAIIKASKKLKDFRLNQCEMYVTLEPCPMCTGAIINSRLKKVYFGAFDERAGCVQTLYKLTEDKRFNHTLTCEGGVLEEECKNILIKFFKEKRK